MSGSTQPACALVPPSSRVALASVGFSAVVAQIVLMRELLIVSYGNELSLGMMLAVWLFWTAIGTSLLGRAFRSRQQRRVLPLLLIVTAAALYAAVFVVRASRGYWNAAPGEALGPVRIFLTSLATLAVFCPLSGWLFASGSRLLGEVTEKDPATAASSMYLLEAGGSALGGVLTSLVLLQLSSSLQIVTIVAIVNLAAAIWIGLPNRRARCIAFLVLVVAGVSGTLLVKRLELRSISEAWPGFRVLAARTSPYGSLAVIDTGANRSLTQNGTILFTAPDQAAAEEAVHFPLLEHPSPKSVLLIGGGLNGSLTEILKYSSVDRVDYVELDPAVLRLGRDFFPRNWSGLATNSRVRVHETDGRLFVKSTPEKFDVIILNLPEPQTAQINRFYTEEFFRETAARLNPGGVFGFQMRAAEEYFSPALTEFLRCLTATVRHVFPDLVLIPGETMHFVASKDQGILTTDPQELLRRIRERGIHTTYVAESYLPYRMSAERVSDLRDELQPRADTRLNSDFAPIAYFFSIELWSTQFSDRYRDVFRAVGSVRYNLFIAGALCFTIVLAFLFGRTSTAPIRPVVAYSVAVMGLTIMGCEILLLLGFEAVYGYVFNELAAIVAGFMAGMAAGSALAIRRTNLTGSDVRVLMGVQVLAAILVLALTPLLAVLRSLPGWTAVAHLTFLGTAIVCGLVGGYQFPVAMRVYGTGHRLRLSSPGTLYGLDLVGASLGAIAISGFLLPLFGFQRTAILLAIVNLGPLLSLVFCLQRSIATSSSQQSGDPKRRSR